MKKLIHLWFKRQNKKIKSILEEGYDNLIISKEEYEAMDPTDKNPSKFYCTFKVHKNHKEGEASPERPIISGSESITENQSLFLEHHLKDIAKNIQLTFKIPPFH